MTYRLTDEAREYFSWTQRRRIQIAQFLFNLAEWIQPTCELDEYSGTVDPDTTHSEGSQ